jgi:DNA-binding response OmpR family regulator
LEQEEPRRVLVAEDHERLARSVAAGLRRYGVTVDVALDGDDALARPKEVAVLECLLAAQGG